MRIIPPKSYTAHRVLGDIVVCLESAISYEARECLASRDDVAERLGQFQLARQLDHGRTDPDEERIEQRCRLLAMFHAFGGGGEPGLVLDRIDSGDPIQR